MLSINVKPGCKDGAKFVFPKEGDQIPGHIPADIAFIVKDKPHPHFERNGVNICYIHKLSLKEALCGATFEVPTLDLGKMQKIQTNCIIKPGITRRYTFLMLSPIFITYF